MKDEHSIRWLCQLWGVAPSGYYRWRHGQPSARQRADVALTELPRGLRLGDAVHGRLRELTTAIDHGVREPLGSAPRFHDHVRPGAPVTRASLDQAEVPRPRECSRMTPEAATDA